VESEDKKQTEVERDGIMEITITRKNISITVKQDKNDPYVYNDLQAVARLLFQDLSLGLPMYDTWNKKEVKK
jgi:hypothetical protein